MRKLWRSSVVYDVTALRCIDGRLGPSSNGVGGDHQTTVWCQGAVFIEYVGVDRDRIPLALVTTPTTLLPARQKCASLETRSFVDQGLFDQKPPNR